MKSPSLRISKWHLIYFTGFAEQCLILSQPQCFGDSFSVSETCLHFPCSCCGEGSTKFAGMCYPDVPQASRVPQTTSEEPVGLNCLGTSQANWVHVISVWLIWSLRICSLKKNNKKKISTRSKPELRDRLSPCSSTAFSCLSVIYTYSSTQVIWNGSSLLFC